MKLVKKVKLAYIIDVCIIALVISPFSLILKPYGWLAMIALSVLVVLAMIFGPLVFSNASPGMSIMGIVIVDKNYRNPGAKAIIKRQLLIPRALFLDFSGIMLGEYDYNLWELKHLKTMTVLAKDQKD